jgi:hypothetical protein
VTSLELRLLKRHQNQKAYAGLSEADKTISLSKPQKGRDNPEGARIMKDL